MNLILELPYMYVIRQPLMIRPFVRRFSFSLEDHGEVDRWGVRLCSYRYNDLHD